MNLELCGFTYDYPTPNPDLGIQYMLIFYYIKKLVMVHLEQGVDMHELFQKMPTFIFDEVIMH